MKNKKIVKGLLATALVSSMLFGGVGTIYASSGKVATQKNTSAKATGVYQGMVDSQSFEVKIGKEYKTIRVLDKNKYLVKGLKKNDNITFTYWVNVKKQNILGSKLIKNETKKVVRKSTSAKANGIYQGMVDEQTFEVKIGNEYKAFRVLDSNKKLVNGLKKGNKIEFTYWVNVNGQNILGGKLVKK